jgi:hypothetical protein
VSSHLATAFIDIPWGVIVVGLIVSAYHACRGYVLQCTYAHHQRSEPGSQFATWSRTKTIVIRCVYDGFFHLLCSVAGFAALWLATCWRRTTRRGRHDRGPAPHVAGECPVDADVYLPGCPYTDARLKQVMTHMESVHHDRWCDLALYLPDCGARACLSGAPTWRKSDTRWDSTD